MPVSLKQARSLKEEGRKKYTQFSYVPEGDLGYVLKFTKHVDITSWHYPAPTVEEIINSLTEFEGVLRISIYQESYIAEYETIQAFSEKTLSGAVKNLRSRRQSNHRS